MDFIGRTGGERVSTATSPINYHSQPLMHGSKLIEPVVSRATSPMDNKVLEDIFGSADNETLHRGKNKVLEVENRIQEVDTAMHRQVLLMFAIVNIFRHSHIFFIY